MGDAHDARGPVLMRPRQAMTWMRGPMTRAELSETLAMERARAGDAMRIETNSGEELLVGPGVARFQSPKVSPRPKPPVGVVLHYTGTIAKPRPAADLREAFGPLRTPSLDAFVVEAGEIPGALALCLQNAMQKQRKASWDFLVARTGAVIQCNLRPRARYTWHAGRDVKTLRRKLTRDLFWNGTKVYDAKTKRFLHPRLPDGSIMGSGNPPCIGIEVECLGRLPRETLAKATVPPSEVVRVGEGLYHAIPDAQMEALVALCGALRDHFGIARTAWYRHAEIRPDNRTDPEPPLDVRALVARLYPEPAEPVEETRGLVAGLV